MVKWKTGSDVKWQNGKAVKQAWRLNVKMVKPLGALKRQKWKNGKTGRGLIF